MLKHSCSHASGTGRRQFMAKLTAFACACGLGRYARAASPRRVELKSMLCARRTQVGDRYFVTYDSTTGDSILDRQLALEAGRLSKTMEIRPAVVIQVDGDSYNALAWNGNLIEGTAGTVFLGIALLRSELDLDRRGWGGLVVAGILAHEFAHIYQFRHDYHSRLVGKATSVVLAELHADFLAGWYLGTKRRAGATMDFGAFADGIYWQGDKQVRNPGHHGTEGQRRAAAIEGFRRGAAGEGPIGAVAQAGVAFVHDVAQRHRE